MDLINSKVSHLGDGRTKAKVARWPVGVDDECCAKLARFALCRVITATGGSRARTMMSTRQVARLGVSYLDKSDGATLGELAKLVDP